MRRAAVLVVFVLLGGCRMTQVHSPMILVPSGSGNSVEVDGTIEGESLLVGPPKIEAGVGR